MPMITENANAAWWETFRSATPYTRLRRRLALALITAAAVGSGFPAVASPLTDCFQRIAVVARHLTPHHPSGHVVHKIHRVAPRPRARPRVALNTATAHPRRTRYILRPRACDTHPIQLMSLVPGASPRPTAQRLLSELVEATPPGVDIASPVVSGPPFAPSAPATPGGFFPTGAPPGAPPLIGIVPPAGPGSPGTPTPATNLPPVPGVVPPVVPPATIAPPVGAPDTPIIIGAPTPTAPVVPIIVGPEGPGGLPGPETGPSIPPFVSPPGPAPSAVPEPATWAMLLSGFFGVGAVFRRKSARRTSGSALASPPSSPVNDEVGAT